ncbi:MAG: hypothetical protein HGB08_03550 [Candidatus Moranbacteria bacterium]|nr:hypothetical protein [Candidatus Moranbacteria bacterium]
MHYKKTAIAAVAILLSTSISGIASAAQMGNRVSNMTNEKNEGAASQIKEQIAEQFCAKIDDLDGSVLDKVASRVSEVRERKTNRENNWEDATTQIDSKVEQFRSERDSNIESHFSALESKVTNDDQKKAVSTFKNTVRKAIEARRSAVDDAKETFRDGVKGAIETRDGAMDTALSTFQDAVTAAVSKTKSDCSSGKTPAEVRTALRTSIQAARDKFAADRKLQAVGSEVETLTKTRNVAIQKAETDFKAALASATTELKKAFPTE